MVLLSLAVMGQLRPAQAHAQAQSCPDTISDNEKAVHYSLYFENFKNGNYVSALPDLRWIINCAPTFPESTNDDRNFRRLIEVYEGLAQASEDGETKRAYLDSALAVHDTAIPVLKEAGAEVNELTWLINKGRFIQTHGEHYPDRINEVPQIYLEAFEMAPGDVDAYYVRIVIDDYVRQGEKQSAVELMQQAEEQFSDNPEMRDYITQMQDMLFRSPDERMEFLEQQLQRNPDNTDLMAELFDIYIRLKHRDKAAGLGQQLLQVQPTARTYRLLAKMHLEDGESREAFELYEQALKLPGAEQEAREIYFNMGLAQQELGRLSNARTYYREALKQDPNFGAAYIAIGDLYVTAVSNCGSFDPEDRAVYWLAADYYERARSVDSSVANAANQKINTYRPSYPTRENLFFKGWDVGQNFSINGGCYSWINETTKVRAP
jgi:tetratricopeptide (TPR) repeat protein